MHGSFFETLRNNAIGIAKARQNPANFAAPHLVRNEFGGSGRRSDRDSQGSTTAKINPSFSLRTSASLSGRRPTNLYSFPPSL